MSKKKDKSMSKRELVSYIHALTGLSFKESRKLCKTALWIAPAVYFLCFDYLTKSGIFYDQKE